MADPIIIVTGSSRGLGRGVAEKLAEAGCSVGIHYAGNVKAAEETVASCKEKAVNSTQKFAMIQGNIGKADDRQSIFDSAMDAFGHVDGLINNAGIGSPGRLDVTEATEDSWDQVLGINLKGPYFLTQKFANYWLQNPGKSNIASGYKLAFVTSISANTASVSRGDYCISKAGLGMASQLWAVRLADEGVQVIEFRPGIMKTDMTSGVTEKYDALIADGLVPQKRWGNAEDVGLAVTSFVGGHFPFSTGDVIYLDGGFHMRSL